MGQNKIYLQVDFQSSEADAQIKKLNQEIANVGETSEKATHKSEQGFRSFSVSVEEAQHAVFGLGEAIAQLAAFELAKEMVEVADKINKVEIALEGMTGSGEAAADMLRSIRQVALTSPFAFEDLAVGAQRLKAFGFEASQIPAAMKAIAATAASLGGAGEMIEHLTQTIGMMYAKDEASSRFLFRGLLKEGIPVLAMVSDAIRKKTGQILSEDQIKDLIEHHRLSGRALADALLEGMQERFGESNKMMSLVSVQATKLSDDLKELAEVIMRDLTPSLVSWIEHIRELVKWFTELPEPVRKLIEMVGELAAAVSILGLAWKVLAGFMEATGILRLIELFVELSGEIALVTATGGTMGEAIAGWAMAAVPASISIAGIVTVLGTLGLMIGTFLATNKLIEWLEDVRVKAEAAGGIQDKGLAAILNIFTFGADQRRQAQESLKEFEAILAKRNELLRAEAVKLAPLAANALPQLAPHATEASAQALDSQNRQFIAIIATAKKHLNETLIEQDKAAMEQLDELTQRALESARAKATGGIAAIQDEMAELNRKIDKVEHPFVKPTASLAEDRARVAEATQLKIQEIVKQSLREAASTQRQLEQKVAEDRIADMKKASELEVALAAQTAQETSEARAMAQTRGLDVLAANEEKIRAATKAATDARQQGELEDYRALAKQRGDTDEMMAAHIANVERQYTMEREKGDMESYARVAKYRMDIEREVVAETRALNEQAFQMQNQNQLDRAQHMGDLLKAQVEAIPAQTEQQKTAQAQAAAQAQIDALQQVYDTQKLLQKAAYDDDLEALNTLLAQKAIVQQTYDDKVTAMVRRRNAQDIKDTQDLEFERAKLQIEAIKKHNEAVIADQKQVYDQIRSGVEKVWDAMTSSAGTFAQRIGNMLKAAFMDAAKSIVTSHASAVLTEAFGKGHVGFGGGGLRQMLGKEPIFGADKMQAPGHLGDVTTISAGGYQAVPVWSLNPSKVEQQITQNVHVSTPEKAASLTSAAGLVALGAAAAGAGSGAPLVTSAATFGSIASGGSASAGGWLSNPFSQLPSFGFGGGAPGSGGAAAAVSSGSLVGMFPNVAPFGMGDLPLMGGGMSASGMGIPAAASKLAALGGFAKMLGFAGKGGGASVNLTAGSLAGTMIPALGLGAGLAGLMSARGLGTHGTGGLLGGAALGAASGLLTFGSLAAMFPVLVAAGPIGWAVAAGIGAAIGISSAFWKTADQKVRSKVKQVYGVDISEANIRMQIVQIAKERYGGNLDVAIASPEVQEIVRMYSVATGKNPSGLPRPMYSATLAQSGAGGTVLQPVYEGGRIVANPYTGTTTTQYAGAVSQATTLHLDPQNAVQLLTSGVTNVLYSNPGTVAAANAAGVASGNSRDALGQAILEPLTVMR